MTLTLSTKAELSNGNSYAVTLFQRSGKWQLRIECNMGAWATWELAKLKQTTGDEIWIDFGAGLRCTNMRALINEACKMAYGDLEV